MSFASCSTIHKSRYLLRPHSLHTELELRSLLTYKIWPMTSLLGMS